MRWGGGTIARYLAVGRRDTDLMHIFMGRIRGLMIMVEKNYPSFSFMGLLASVLELSLT
jgi:hypothetical protein